MGSNLGLNLVITKVVKRCTYCCYVRCAVSYSFGTNIRTNRQTNILLLYYKDIKFLSNVPCKRRPHSAFNKKLKSMNEQTCARKQKSEVIQGSNFQSSIVINFNSHTLYKTRCIIRCYYVVSLCQILLVKYMVTKPSPFIISKVLTVYSNSERGVIGLFITLVPKVLYYHFPTRWR